MGTAALDLPDPLEAPPDGPKGSTDDLLAQLAGDEIDRLLAEADEASAVVRRAPVQVAPATLAGQEPVPAAAADSAPSGPAPLEPPAPPKLSQACEEISAELDALFNQPVTKDVTTAGTPAPVTSDADGSPSEAISAATLEAEAELDAATTAAERDGLKTPAGVAPLHTTGGERAPSPAPARGEEDAPLPIYLRPLEWLNAPLALFPESVRDLIGKAAIVTLLNAAAIVAYVLVVRRGH